MNGFKEGVLTNKGRIVGLRYFRKCLILVDIEDGNAYSPESLKIIDENNNQINPTPKEST